MKNIVRFSLLALCILFAPSVSFGVTLLQENFDNNNFATRGWYDGNTAAVDPNNHITGSTASLICHFLLSGTHCNPSDGQYSLRHAFTASNSVYISYWIKHSSNWVGSAKPYHPHVFYLLTNMDGVYDGLAYDYLTAYIEENQGYPEAALQDGKNIDETKIGVDLTNITENRAATGCNGIQPNLGQSYVDCYPSGSVHWNGIVWKGTTAYFFDPNQKTNWHFVEAYFQLNSISNGIGQPDGIVRYWYDEQLVIDHSNIIMRTGKNPTMQFNQVVIAPYIGDGSPADQAFWIDNLTVATSRLTSPPSPPANLNAQ